jgi:hypothetical protein
MSTMAKDGEVLLIFHFSYAFDQGAYDISALLLIEIFLPFHVFCLTMCLLTFLAFGILY